MTQTQAFDAVHSPLAGISLIEASAGTGKTYTIATLILRLVVEHQLLINQILVVTFTNAATEELRDRIRNRLQEARLACERREANDPTLTALLLKWQDLDAAKIRLNYAIQGFDEAPVFTIHGFCQRVLRDHAFESGALFDTELIKDETSLLQEIMDDFWRQHLYRASPLFVRFVLEQQKLTPEKLLALLQRYTGQPLLKVVPTQVAVLAADEAQFTQAYHQVRQLWWQHQEEVTALLLSSPSLSRTKYKVGSVKIWLTELETWLAADQPRTVFENGYKFCQSEINSGTNKGKIAPQSVFFEAFQHLWELNQQLEQAYSQRLLALKISWLQRSQQELKRRKQQHNIQGFDDLLHNLYRALRSKGGLALLNAIRKRYCTALIDEFQDTDPLQYEIFQRIYQRPEPDINPTSEPLTPELRLFLIGDPKQAIYSFRGADIFAYIRASSDATQRYTLGTNWRSIPPLIAAVNTLFQNVSNPFLFTEIPFHPVSPAKTAPEPAALAAIRHWSAPLQFWWLDGTAMGQSPEAYITKEWAEQHLPHWVAEEIVRLLSVHAMKAGSIAVLVRTNQQAQRMQSVLRQRQVPSVIYSHDRLFASREAEQVAQILAAIAEPTQDHLLRAALVTDLLGLNGNQLEQLQQDEVAWEHWLLQFRRYHDTWRYGFMPMFRQFMANHQVAERLLSFVDGERRLTNVLHLLEQLHQASVSPQRGMAQLLRWFAAARQGIGVEQDEAQLRLESDEEAVKLVTIHKSKGLEYDIVFVPFAWDGALRTAAAHQAEAFVFHDSAAEWALTLDMGTGDNAHREQATLEEQAENLRLLYVALTRARWRCFVIWGWLKRVEQSALSHLLVQPQDLEPSGQLTSDLMQTRLTELASRSMGTIAWGRPTAPTKARYAVRYAPNAALAAAVFPNRRIPHWQIASFTGLLAGGQGRAALPDYDAVTIDPLSWVEPRPTPVVSAQQAAIFAFPAGARTGQMLHELLEKLNFPDYQRTAPTLIKNSLAHYGYEAHWQETLLQWLHHILLTPLSHENPALQLVNIPWPMRLNELEFFFPVKTLTRKGLAAVIAARADAEWLQILATQLDDLQFPPVQGFMTGYIDLIFAVEGRFFVVDYKSNHLGDEPMAYNQAGLLQAMHQHYYYLQCLLYSVALHRYLQLRLVDYDYERHFGGGYYLFLRGMNPALGPDYGVWFERPSLALLNDLSDYLAH